MFSSVKYQTYHRKAALFLLALTTVFVSMLTLGAYAQDPQDDFPGKVTTVSPYDNQSTSTLKRTSNALKNQNSEPTPKQIDLNEESEEMEEAEPFPAPPAVVNKGKNKDKNNSSYRSKTKRSGSFKVSPPPAKKSRNSSKRRKMDKPSVSAPAPVEDNKDNKDSNKQYKEVKNADFDTNLNTNKDRDNKTTIIKRTPPKSKIINNSKNKDTVDKDNKDNNKDNSKDSNNSDTQNNSEINKNGINSRRLSPSSKGASSDLPVKIVIGPEKSVVLKAAGVPYNVRLRTTGVEDEYLVAANDKAWPSIARAFGKELFWNSSKKRLEVKSKAGNFNLKMGEDTLPGEIGGRKLDVVPQEVDGTPCFPVSALEDFLGVRVTVSRKTPKGWIEPLITTVKLEGDGRKPNLVIHCNNPVTFSTFTLTKPDRYVIDVAGGVLDTQSLRVNHPELGNIRLGQFTLEPAVSRIVIPIIPGLKVKAPQNKASKDFTFALTLPETSPDKYTFVQQKLLKCNVEALHDAPILGLSGTPATSTVPPIATSAISSSTTIKLATSRLSTISSKTNLELSAKDSSEGTKVELEFSGPVEYEWSRLAPPDNRFVIDLQNVVLVGKRQELKVNTNFIDLVRVSQYQSSPQPITRVVIDLKKAAIAKIGKGSKPNSLAVTVAHSTIEPSMAMLKGYGSTLSVSGSSPVIPSLGIGTRTVCIDAGHGGSDSGAVHHASGLMEKDVTLGISRYLAEVLKEQGWRVLETRTTDRDVSWAGSSNSEELWARVSVANDNHADIFISIHCNASVNPSAEGTSLHVYKRSDRVLATKMHPLLISATGRYDRGIQQDRFFVLAHTTMPAVLIETAFISHSGEAKLLGSPDYQLKVAQSIAQGLNTYANKYLRSAK